MKARMKDPNTLINYSGYGEISEIHYTQSPRERVTSNCTQKLYSREESVLSTDLEKARTSSGRRSSPDAVTMDSQIAVFTTGSISGPALKPRNRLCP
ncbi:hypothetical protein NL676_034811 [Syzygium grande]|nr:hypothetical protein NL676_034811 [Syzygium grande]